MSIPKFTDDLNIIAKLGDYPTSQDGLTTNEFKKEFDKAGLALQKYLNEQIQPPLDAFAGGTVATVNNKSPIDGNVNITAQDVGALPTTGGSVSGGLDMTAHAIKNVSSPSENGDAANKKYVDDENARFLETGKKYADNSSNNAVKSANGYTNREIVKAISYTDSKLTESKHYTDGKISKANSYADSVAASKANTAESNAKSFATTKANAAESNAESYAKSYAKNAVNGVWDVKKITVSGWSGKTVTVSCPGMTTSAKYVHISPAPPFSNQKLAAENLVVPQSQGNGTLTFQCDTVPSGAVYMNVAIYKGA